MSHMQVLISFVPGNPQLFANVNSALERLPQGMLVDVTVPWTQTPYASLGLPPGAAQIAAEVGIDLSGRVFGHPNAVRAYEITKAAQSAERGIHILMQGADDAHRIPWELLRSAQGFCTLQDGVPIVRIAPSQIQRSDGVIIDGRLKMIVVLGAQDVPCEPEWLKLEQALQSWPRDIELLVLTYDPALKSDIDNAPASQGAVRQVDGRQVVQRVTAAFIPGSAQRLMQIISDEAPHIVHFFCHGTSEKAGELEIAHRGTVVAGDRPLSLQRTQLGELGNSAWLMVLNACETATPVGTAGQPAPAAPQPTKDGSFATALVGAGIPYVLGMRQRIDSRIVPPFTSAFYAAVFRSLRQSLAPGRKCVINLDAALIDGQRAICEQFAPSPADACLKHQDWSLPVLYKRRDPFCVRLVPGAVAGAPQPTFDDTVHLVAERKKLKEVLEEMEREGVNKPVVTAGISARIKEIDELLGSVA